MNILINSFKHFFLPHDKKKEHFKALDGLRGIAVIFVLLSHSSNQQNFFHEALNFERIGKVGVYLFFVLSAYLLDRQIALAFLFNKSSKSYWKNYALRRFLRIYPLYLVSLFIYTIVSVCGLSKNITNMPEIENMTDIISHMLLVRGDGVFWSIPVEFKYYFVSPFIIWICHKYLMWNKYKIIILLSSLIFGSIMIEAVYDLPIVSTIKFFPIFLVGTAISIFELKKNKFFFLRINQKKLSLLGWFSIVTILITIPYYFENIFNRKINFHSSFFFFPYATLWGIILLATKYGIGLIRKMLETKVLRYIGTISFSMYLFHMLVLNFVIDFNINQSLKPYLFFLITIILSSLSYLLIERPLSKIYIKKEKKANV